MPEDKLKLLYDAMKNNPDINGLPADYSTFASVMSDTNKAKLFYEQIKKDENIKGLPENSTLFIDALGLKKKDTATSNVPSGPSASDFIPGGSPLDTKEPEIPFVEQQGGATIPNIPLENPRAVHGDDKDIKFWNYLGKRFESGSAQILAATLRTPETLWDVAANAGNLLLQGGDAIANALGIEGEIQKIQTSKEIGEAIGIENKLAKAFEIESKVLDSIDAKYQKPILESIKNGNYKDALINISGNITQSLPFMLGMILPGAAGVSVAKQVAGTTAVMGAQRKQNLIDRDDLSETQKNVNATIYGLAESLDVLLGAGTVGRAIKSIATKEGEQTVKKFGTELMDKVIKDNPYLQPFAEALQGGTTQYIQNVADITLLGEKKNAMDGVADAMIVEGTMGLLGASAINATKVISKISDTKTESKTMPALTKNELGIISKAAKDKPTYDAIINEINKRVEFGVLTPEQSQQQVDVLNSVVETINKIPEEFTVEQKNKAIELITEKQELENEASKLDKVFASKNDEKINQINNELQKIAEPKVTMPVKSDEAVAKETEPKKTAGFIGDKSMVEIRLPGEQTKEVTSEQESPAQEGVKEITPQPEVKTNETTAITEVLQTDKYKDFQQGGILFSKFKDKDISDSEQYKDENGEITDKGVVIIDIFDKNGNETPYGRNVKKLEESGYIEDFGDERNGVRYGLTQKGKEFIDAVNQRIETRKGVKEGTDLFPEEANIPELQKTEKPLDDFEQRIEDTRKKVKEFNKKYLTAKGADDITTMGVTGDKAIDFAFDAVLAAYKIGKGVKEAVEQLMQAIKDSKFYRTLPSTEQRKFMGMVREQTSRYPRATDNIKIDKDKQQVRKYIKNNEYTSKYLPYAQEMSKIPKRQLSNMPDDLYKKVYDTMDELANKKVSDVKNLQETYKQYNTWKESIYKDKISNDIALSESLDDIQKILDSAKGINTDNIKTFEDIVDYKRQRSLIERQTLDFLDREGLTYEDGVILDGAKNEVTKYKLLQDFLNEAYSPLSKDEFFRDLNNVNDVNITADRYAEIEKDVISSLIKDGKSYEKDIDWSSFDEAETKYIKDFLSSVTPGTIAEMSLSDIDTYNKVMEQLTYGNLPTRVNDIRNQIEVIKNNKFIESHKNTVTKKSKLWARLQKHGGFTNLVNDIARKYITNIDSKYGTSKVVDRLFYDFLNTAIAKYLDFTEKKIRDQIDKRIAYNADRRAGNRTSKREVYEREVGMLSQILSYQLNLPADMAPKIAKAFGVSEADAYNYYKLMYETEAGGKRFADKKNTRLSEDSYQYDKEAYNNLKKRNGGKDIIVDASMTDKEIINTVVKKLLNKHQFNHFKNLYEGYQEQISMQKENAIRQGIGFNERRMYFPNRVLEKSNQRYDDGVSFFEGLTGKKFIVPKSGNVNPKSEFPFFVELNASKVYRGYTRTNFMDYYIRDKYNNLLRSFEEVKKTLSDKDEIEYISSLSKGLEQRMKNVYGLNTAGAAAIDKTIDLLNQYSRIPIMSPTRMPGEALSNPFMALGRVSSIKDYLRIFRSKSERDMVEYVIDELGIEKHAGGAFAAEIGETSKTAQRVSRNVSIFDDKARMNILRDGFSITFRELTGEQFNLEKYKTDTEYKKKYKEAFDKASLEAKYRYEQYYPTSSKFSTAQFESAGGKTFNKINRVMMTYVQRNAAVLLHGFKDLALGTNEGRLQAARDISAVITSNAIYGTYQIYRKAGYLAAVGAIYGALGEDERKKEAFKKMHKITDRGLGNIIAAEGISALVSTPLATFGNLGRDAMITLSSIVNNAAYGKNLSPELKDKIVMFNTIMDQQFYVRPIMTEGYGSRKEQIRSILNALPTFSRPVNDATDAGMDIVGVINKAANGEKLSEYESEILGIVKLTSNVLFGVAFGVPIMTDISPEVNNMINNMMGVSQAYERDLKKLQGTQTELDKTTPEEKSAKTLKNIAEKEQLSKELGIEYIKNKSEAKELIKHPETRSEGKSALKKIMEEKRRKKEKLND